MNPYDGVLLQAFDKLADANKSGDPRRTSRAELESMRLKNLHREWHMENAAATRGACESCGNPTHRDDAMNRRCNGCERLTRQCICQS